MDSSKRLWELINAVKEQTIDVPTFADHFTIIFDQETDYDELTMFEETNFLELSRVTGRYSPYLEDLAIPNAFSNDKEVLTKIDEILEQSGK